MKYPEYFEWQNLLEAKLIHRKQGAIMFYVDEDEIARLKPGSINAAEELSKAVVERLRVDRGKNMFSPITADLTLWSRTERVESPPVLPVIALSVLAATRMRTSLGVRATNYYHRLAELLVPGSNEAEILSLRNQLREAGAFVDVVRMWESLQRWVVRKFGEAAAATIKSDPRFPRIGYPLSQAIIRDSDRSTLTRLFKAMDLLSEPFPDEVEILGALDIWTTSARNRLTSSGMRALTDGETRPLLGDLVSAYAKNWDGEVLVPDGDIRVELRLCLNIDEWSAEWIFIKSSVLPDRQISLYSTNGRKIVLESDPGSELFLTSNRIGVNSTDVELGQKFAGDGYSAEFAGSEIVFFAPDANTDGCTSVFDLTPHTDYLVAVHTRRLDEFRQYLDQVAVEGWRYLPQTGRELVPNFSLFEGVEFASNTDIEGIANIVPGAKLIGISANVSRRAKLVGGLPIATDLARSTYLVGGEPDLQLPASAEEGSTTVILDGRMAEFRSSAVAVSLRHFVDAPGKHTIRVGDQVLTFYNREADPRRDPFSYNRAKSLSSREVERNTKEPLPALLPNPVYVDRPARMLARRGRDETWVLQAGGRYSRVIESDPPRFLEELAIEIYLPYFEFELPEGAKWLAQRRGSIWMLSRVGTREDEYVLRSVDVLSAWKRACKDQNAMRLWDFQLKIAR